MDVPRIVVAGAGSGVGKTTTVVALARALARRGLDVVTFKCGPDYLDPTHHARATGRASPNLDGWLMGHEAVRESFAAAAAGRDLAIVEGMMGLFDGLAPESDEGSTAEIARWLDAPVLVCVDASGAARTLAALAQGLAGFSPETRVAGVLAQRVGGHAHLELLRRAPLPVPLFGGLPERPELAVPERHLGLPRADARSLPYERIETWAELAAEHVDLDALLALARSAPSLEGPTPRAVAPRPATRCRIGVARDEAFHFYYGHNLAALEAHGAELVDFSPLEDDAPPDVDGLLLGGGYPELHAAALAANDGMRDGLRRLAARGAPVLAECGGLLYAAEAIVDLEGSAHAMLGLVPGRAVMGERIAALGYVEVRTRVDTALGPAGTRFRGHQFRYSRLEGGEAGAGPLRAVGPGEPRADPPSRSAGSVLASYVHAHWARSPEIPARFVDACVAARGTR